MNTTIHQLPSYRQETRSLGGAIAAPVFWGYAQADYEHAGVDLASGDWRRLQASYDNLPVDAYLPAGETYRQRRFGRFCYDVAANALQALPHGPFFQAKQFNRLSGGVDRDFAPLASDIQRNATLAQLIRFHVDQIQPARPAVRRWRVYVHQIRITGHDAKPGQPTPEGVHQDGHCYIAQILINRTNVIGAETRIYDLDKQPVLATTLQRRLDSLLIEDATLFHEVTAIRCAHPARPAWRDMLLLDFNPMGERHEN